MNIALCGMMGVGKTTVGKLLAAKTGRRWADTDAVIVSRYGSISELFAAHGEGYFRDLESAVTQELSQEPDLILSLGGGLVLRRENVEALKASGIIVYLQASEETLCSRVKADDNRPLLREGAARRIHELLAARASVYESCADLIVSVDGKTAEAVAEELFCLLKERL